MIMFAPLLFLADPHAASAMQVGPNPSQRQESTLPIPHRRTIIETAPTAEAGGPERKPATTDRLADCLGRAQRDSAAGIAFARGWLAEGATPEARVRANQCLGLIQSDLGDFGNAERSFTDALQGIPEAQKVAGVPLLAMAGNAALAGGAAARALDGLVLHDEARIIVGVVEVTREPQHHVPLWVLHGRHDAELVVSGVRPRVPAESRRAVDDVAY